MKSTSGKLSPDAKVFAVCQLACFRTPKEVAAAIKAEFGVAISPQAVEHYHPDRVAGKGLAPDLVELFRDARKRYLSDTSAIPIASNVYRQEVRQRILDAHLGRRRPNLSAALETLADAAREDGGVYTNARALDLTSGGRSFGVLAVAGVSSREEWERVYGDTIRAEAAEAAAAADGGEPPRGNPVDSPTL
jgi:hypothetical protein